MQVYKKNWDRFYFKGMKCLFAGFRNKGGTIIMWKVIKREKCLFCKYRSQSTLLIKVHCSTLVKQALINKP